MGGDHQYVGERIARKPNPVPGDDLGPFEVLLPKGYYRAASGDMLPWFDNEGRGIVLICERDGSVRWELRGRDGTVLAPAPTTEGTNDGG